MTAKKIAPAIKNKPLESSIKKDTTGIKEYAQTLAHLKKQVQETQVKAALSANKELIKLYWTIGKTIVERQEVSGWGSKLIEKLAKDLQNSFPGVGGFSRANIFYMRSFYRAYEIVQTASGQLKELGIFNIPWYHNIILLTKLKNNDQRLWYAQKALSNGWSGNTLEMTIESDLYYREGKALTNFHQTLPAPQSDMASQVLKDPYVFDFLTLHDDYIEKDVEQGLVDHIQKFLLELGHGFAFVGRQVNLHVDEEDYYIDLLFYHTKLHCYCVVELKNTKFKPEYAGKMSFYLAAVDESLKHKDDNPTIGLLLCKSKKKLTVEYALRSNTSPIGVASYETKILEKLPKNLKGSLPTIKDFEAELEKQEARATLQKKKVRKGRKK